MLANMLIDTHCHLDYFDEPLLVASQCFDANAIDDKIEFKTSHLITISTKLSEFSKVIAIANSMPNIFCSLGNHPCNVQHEQPLNIKQALDVCLANKSKIVAIGETGLDYYHDASYNELQKAEFLKHIELASQCNLAIVVHVRDAWDDALAIIAQSLKAKPDLRFVIHCFTGGIKQAEVLNELGCYVSISGIVTFKSSKALQEAVKIIRPDRLLVETDSPFLAPAPHRGKQNHPSYVSYVLSEVVKLAGVGQEQIYQNSKNAFNLKI
jgi:TatD DNase family protein